MKFSIVTPSYNCSDYIQECLNSVLNQSGNFAIEHIVIDGNSTDETINILKNFEDSLNSEVLKPKCKKYEFKWISEKDNGMYDAILKGFKMSSGDIMAWINADDKYQDGAFERISEVFNKDRILWVKGITDYILEDGTIKLGKYYRYSQSLIKKGVYGTLGRYIQQDSVFWKRELWDLIEHDQMREYKLAGDFRLWQMFAEKSSLHTIRYHLSYFRKRKGQLSGRIDEYRKEVDKTVSLSNFEENIFRMYFFLEKIFYFK